MKLMTRTLIILALMIAGAWISNQGFLSGLAGSISVYAAYLLIGITLGSMTNPRFTNAKNKWIYMIPILIFVVIGLLNLLYSFLHAGAWPFDIGNYLLNFSALAWTITGVLVSIAFR
jgi:hypothetical protein